ncbi:MAG TPA: AAA family ATPase, partial [Kofleriaceae bacterium]|nr:AAA family ATPase [Kofleriaceae bacterium]
ILADAHLERLRSLFGSEILGTRFIELLTPELGKAFVKTLQQVLIAGELLPHVTALELRGRGGIQSHQHLTESQRFEMDVRGDDGTRIRVPATWLSQGYQSVIAWISDIIGQVLLDHAAPIDAAEMQGCVLIDEIDLHLHPTWQVRLIPALKKVFPKLQFIATTHSPMMMPGLEADEIYLLTQDAEGSVLATPSHQSPALMTGSELYEAFFAISKLYPNDLGAKSQRYMYLASDPTRTQEQDAEMHALRTELGASGVTYDWEPVPREGAA